MKCLRDCGAPLGRASDVVKCSKCGQSAHKACAGIRSAKLTPVAWLCPVCAKNTQKSETPNKGQESTLEGDVSSQQQLAPCIQQQLKSRESSQASAPGTSEIVVDPGTISLELAEIRALRGDIARMRADFECRLVEVTGRMDLIDKRVDALETAVAEKVVAAGNRVLEEAVAQLQNALHDRDQELLVNDLQVTGVPEAAGDSPNHLLGVIAAKLGVPLDERDVVFAERAGPKRADSDRPRALTVRFARRTTRDSFLKAARVRRGATTADLGLAGEPRRFYVNERLTHHNRQIFNQAREKARLAGWRYVWTREGRVSVRRAEGQPAYRLRCEADLEKYIF